MEYCLVNGACCVHFELHDTCIWLDCVLRCVLSLLIKLHCHLPHALAISAILPVIDRDVSCIRKGFSTNVMSVELYTYVGPGYWGLQDIRNTTWFLNTICRRERVVRMYVYKSNFLSSKSTLDGLHTSGICNHQKALYISLSYNIKLTVPNKTWQLICTQYIYYTIDRAMHVIGSSWSKHYHACYWLVEWESAHC